MKIRNIIYLFILYLNIAFPQNRWQFVNPLPTGFNLYNIKVDANNKIWAVGEYGTMITSTDDFKTWDIEEINRTEDLYDLEIKNDKIWVIGQDGLILFSPDGGNTWGTQKSSTDINLLKIQFIDDDHGWIMASDSLILKTDNGGITWQKIPTEQRWSQNDILFLNNDDGFLLTGDYYFPNLDVEAYASGALFKTNDGGQTWIKIDSGSTKFSSIFFLNNENGYMSVHNLKQGGIFLKTNDSCKTWDTLSYPYEFSQISFSDEQNGIAISNSYFAKTTDGGLNWNTKNAIITPSPESILTSFFRNQSQVYAVGTEGNILKSSDFGESWKSINSGIDFYYASLKGVQFINSKIGYIYGQQYKNSSNSASILMSTSDGGQTWNNLSSPDSGYISILKEKNDTVWAASGTRLYVSDDNFKSWKNVLDVALNNDEQIRDIYLFNNQHIVLLAGRRVYQTYDSGLNWSFSSEFYVQFLRQFVKITNNKWIILGTNAVTEPNYVTQDNGSTWTLMDHHFTSMKFLNENTGYGIDSSLFKTSDGGNTWIEINESLKSIAHWTSILYFYNESIGWLNTGSYLYFTKDGGITWNREYGAKGISNLYPTAMSVVRDSAVWAVGGNGRIFKLSLDEITSAKSTNNIVLNNFILYQNYPNPFNPETTIRFSIPKSGNVSLFIYDILGRKIYTLLNKFMKPGMHEINFNGSNFSSGVYFYKVTWGKYSTVKKFVILK